MNIITKTIAVKIMAKLKVKNLDELYSTLKSLSGELKVTGWDARYEGYVFHKADTLLEWFFNNISRLKEGVKDLLVSTAVGSGEYHIERDRLLISTERTGLGLLVVVKVEWSDDNGYYDMSGRYKIESGEKESAFLLKCEEN